MSLKLDNVDYCYSPGTAFSVRALESVSFEVGAGELVLILGATGSGKSTLLRLAAGLTAPTSGTVSVDGRPLTATEARGVVGLVFQDAESQLFAETVAEDVAFGPQNLGATRADARVTAEWAMREVGLDPGEFGDRSPFALSGGEARRVALAGVLAMRPKYLLADEPTAGLDARGRTLLRDAIVGMSKSAGVVVVSHSAEEFLPVADSVVLLADGQVVWCGPTPDLVAAPDLFATAGLVPPDVLEVQRLLAEKRAFSGAFALDPIDAVEALVREGVAR